ncbi:MULTISPECIES: GNAT family N-acetyltransferase [unclassified Tenacibaculum]|uniref:GNAT family N-acetyltransferase n=1 Tax=unclassified Tenacibaculum TaxID=2635139 RepID=UPI001F35DE32|nr:MULTISPECIES: GNAT family N-acetyltransferase [unclassified Tenacibaculum]MCF2873130.1 GNAT family N-acetyltransferase [Tenacibaculum sp. Cn5-1]MCF2933286.1 GNAT family N-acetyltransferase [Tenacibaculum sp. Cn5-34]MCG7510133.1 GNAT family N-acetyltransferase [Tenacibaculum sp. Cn5-46]
MNLSFKAIDKKNILSILPLLKKVNTTTPHDILEKRVSEMIEYDTYECVGVFDNDKLIGISGLWYSLRHYSGKSVEPDHVIIDETYRGKNIGKQFFNWIYEYTKSKGCEVIELNTYTGNRKSHKFYYNEGFEIYGFHFLKVMREDQKFY